MYCSFRGVTAYRQEIMYATFPGNIEPHRQYNDYIWNNKK